MQACRKWMSCKERMHWTAESRWGTKNLCSEANGCRKITDVVRKWTSHTYRNWDAFFCWQKPDVKRKWMQLYSPYNKTYCTVHVFRITSADLWTSRSFAVQSVFFESLKNLQRKCQITASCRHIENGCRAKNGCVELQKANGIKRTYVAKQMDVTKKTDAVRKWTSLVKRNPDAFFFWQKLDVTRKRMQLYLPYNKTYRTVPVFRLTWTDFWTSRSSVIKFVSFEQLEKSHPDCQITTSTLRKF